MYSTVCYTCTCYRDTIEQLVPSFGVSCKLLLHCMIPFNIHVWEVGAYIITVSIPGGGNCFTHFLNCISITNNIHVKVDNRNIFKN